MQFETECECNDRLISLVRESQWMMDALIAVRSLGLVSWCIGAGAVRNLVWDAIHEKLEPSELADVDVAYFDAECLVSAQDKDLQAKLSAALPGVPWEVTNQAAVHLWFEQHFGHPVPPLNSLMDAVASWPEYATSVGIRLELDESITVIAPHGLEDLFACVVRRNPVRVSVNTYRQRVEQKRYSARWPRVQVVPC
ncbi:nucleotidyltransferase family protein [Roseateles albus]|uniref:Nucleotidyltransferase family protein n=1 Tax=Roseateles albus TaxID=2987525 RepID=A0ABT5KHP7_9BURK|nr:nucleotidyltransferase family protein [Roseateles albus]MDC8773438.1 nucleotidyltransferase family protein [Roseateles albus]